MTGLDGLMESDHWYKGMIVAGVALAVGALGFHERDFALMGVGLAVGGFGEWLNHGYRQHLYADGRILHDRSRRPIAFGIALDIGGGVLFAVGLVRGLL